MYLRSAFSPLLVLLVVFQSPQDSIRRHYQTAETYRLAGNLGAAEAEFGAILAEAYSRLGKVYTARKQYKEAITVLDSAAIHQPDSEEVLIDLAIAYFDAGQYERALAPARKLLGINPANNGAHHMLGKTHFMLGEFAKSISELETALKLAPKDYDAAYTLGLSYLKQRQFVPAKQIYERILKQFGDSPQLRIIFGRAYRETGFLTEAIEEFRRAVSIDPRFPRVHYYLGLTYLLRDGADRLKDAEAEFRLELTAHPDEYFANYYLGIISTINRKWDVALGFLLKASQIQRDNPDPHFYLGQTYQGLGMHDQAIESLRKSIALNPDLRHNDYQVTNAHYRLAQSLLKVGQTAEGRKELQIASELKTQAFKRDEAKAETFTNAAGLSPQSEFPRLVLAPGLVVETKAPEGRKSEALQSEADFYEKVVAIAHNNIGLLQAERQDFPKAIEQFKLATKWNPQLEGLSYNLGLAYYKAESYKDAVVPLENAVQTNPANLTARQLLGLSYFMTDNFEKAAALLSEVAIAKPKDVTLYYPLALSLGKLGQTDAVNRVVQQMLTAGGDSPQVHIVIARAYYEQGAGAKALEELQTALLLDSKVRLAHFYSGLVYLKMGNLVEAVREFEAELSLNPPDLQAKYHLGYALLANQETKRGMQLLREVIQAQPDFSNAYFELGKAQLQQGDIEASVKNLEAAAKLTPDLAHIHYQLGRAYLAAGRKAEAELQFERAKQLKDKARGQTNP